MSILKSGKILVTGADGFIGSHLVESLVRQGHDVRAFALYNSFNSWGWLDHIDDDLKEKVDVFTGDIRDPYGCREALKNCHVVFHLAALIAIPYSYHSPSTYVDTNVTGTTNIMQAAKDLGLSRIIHTSTSEVYGSAQSVPINEDHPLVGQSPYSATKIGADQIALSFYRSFDLPVSVVRPFNTYGPRQSARAIIPTVITQLAAGKDKIHLGNIEPTRDFSFVQDTVDGFIALAESEKAVGTVTNLGSGFEISIADTVVLIQEIMGTKAAIITDDQRIRPENSEVDRLFADISKAKEISTWKPQYAGIEGFRKGLEPTINFFRDSNNLKLYKHGIYNI